MNGAQFIRALRSYARANGLDVELLSARGKGGHQMLRLSSGGQTTVKTGEIGPGLKAAMLKQLGLPKDAI